VEQAAVVPARHHLDARARHAEARELATEARRGFVTQGNAHWIRRADIALARLATTGSS
jgi:hypothetical protein